MWISKRVLLAALGALALTAAVPATAVAAARAPSVRPHLPDATIGVDGPVVARYLVLEASEPVDEPVTVSIRLDITEVAAFADIATFPECVRTGNVLTCDLGRTGIPDWPVLSVGIRASAGAHAGDSGSMLVTATTEGRPESVRTKVTVGEPVDLGTDAENEMTVKEGALVRLPLAVRNSGTRDVDGAVLRFDENGLLRRASNYSNCRYSADGPTVCQFDTRLAPGATYRVAPLVGIDRHVGPPLKAFVSTRWLTAAEWADERADLLASGVRLGPLGTGRPLALAPGQDTPAGPAEVGLPQADIEPSNNSSQTWLNIIARDTPDFAAVGASITGPPYSLQTARIGVRNTSRYDGVAQPGTDYVTTVLVGTPGGTESVAVPPFCAPYWEGEFWWTHQGDPGALLYMCRIGPSIARGTTFWLDFTYQLSDWPYTGHGDVTINRDESFQVQFHDSDPGNDHALITAEPAA